PIRRFDGHDHRIIVGREPDLGRAPWECRWVEPAPKLVCGEGRVAGVAVQEAAGTGAGIDGLRGVGKQTHLGIRPHLEAGDVRANATDRIEARPARIEHVEQVLVYGQTGWKQAARGYSVHERQAAILGYAERGNRAPLAVANIRAVARVLGEAFGVDREETT